MIWQIWIYQNQYFLYLGMLGLGALVTIGLLRLNSRKPLWDYVDLVWIAVGGGSALSVLVLSVLLTDVTEYHRQADQIHVRLALVSLNADRIWRAHCFQKPFMQSNDGDHRRLACFDLIDIGLAADRDLSVKRLDDIYPEGSLRSKSFETSWPFNGEPHKNFATVIEGEERSSWLPMGTNCIGGCQLSSEAASNLISKLYELHPSSAISAEYFVVRQQLVKLRDEVNALLEVWKLIEGRRYWAVLRVCALALLSLILPLRVGKSIAGIRSGLAQK